MWPVLFYLNKYMYFLLSIGIRFKPGYYIQGGTTMSKEDFHFTHKIQYTGYTTWNSRRIEYYYIKVAVADCRCHKKIEHPYV